MGHISLRKSEQDFYESTMRQSNVVIVRAQSEANTMMTDMIKSICESHEQDPPITPQGLTFTGVKNKKGVTIAMLWGKELKDWQEGNLSIEGGVYPPGLPIRAKPQGNGAPLPAKGEGAGATAAGPSETMTTPAAS